LVLAYFLLTNLDDYLGSSTITTLQTATGSLDDIYYPSVTVCNMNQIRDSWWKNVGIPIKTDARRKKFVSYFFTGSKKEFSEAEKEELEGILNSPEFQNEFCNYLIHTRIYEVFEASFLASTPFDGTKCNIGLKVEDFINQMSVLYTRGHFILGAEFNKISNFELFPDVGTETGFCKTIKPIVDFNPKLKDTAARDRYKIELGSEVLSGESNGLNVLLDVETFDYGYVPAKGSGVFMVVNHHGDKPILNSGRIKLQPGTDTDVQINPSFTTTDESAIEEFEPEDRKCYECNEINMLFLPYQDNLPENCNKHGYRYSMSNCVFESAFEATLKTCECFPLFHQNEYHEMRRKNLSRLISMPFMANIGSNPKGEPGVQTCRGVKLNCAYNIFNEMSKDDYKQIYDAYTAEPLKCREPCTDFQYSMETTTSSYPAFTTFTNSKEACFLIIKFFENCRNFLQKVDNSFETAYPEICKTVRSQSFRSSFKEKFISLGLETSLIDDPDPDLEWKRQKVVMILCNDDTPENWEDILEDTSEEFQQELLKYAKENLIKMHLFISSPFTTEYQRYVKTTKINFVANLGGLMGLCMGFSFVSLMEIIYYIGRIVFDFIKKIFNSNEKIDVDSKDID